MADFLTAVKSVRKEAETPSAVLTEISTQTVRKAEEELIAEAGLPHDTHDDERIDSPEEALRFLKSQPDLEPLIRVLRRVRAGFSDNDFNISTPGPKQAQIINTLVSVTIPTFWSTLGGKGKAALLDCLRNAAGSSALVARLRLLAGHASSGKIQELDDVLSVTRAILKGDDFGYNIWTGLLYTAPKSGMFADKTKRQLAWKEFVTLVTSGRVVAAVAQAEDALKANDKFVKASWLSTGTDYAAWLGRNVADFLAQTKDGGNAISGTSSANAQLLIKAFGLGYPVPLVRGLMTAFALHSVQAQHAVKAFPFLLKFIPTHAVRPLMENTLKWLSTLSEAEEMGSGETPQQQADVQGIAALLAFLVGSHPSVKEQLIESISDPVFLSSTSVAVRRAIIAALSFSASDDLQGLLETLMSTFGEKLFIDHAPALQQEAIAQVLLLSAGSIHRKTPMAVLLTARSSNHMQGVSRRLDSSNQKARWLGMVIATAISALVDKQGSRMNFGSDELQTDGAKWYQTLATLNDPVGSLKDFHRILDSRARSPQPAKLARRKDKAQDLPILNGKQTFGPARPPQTEVIGERISELTDDDYEDEDDHDLKPYAKPDSDPEDSDEDATLVNRNKARAPVYIRDLMRMLKDDKDHDRFQMAVKCAPALIRKKTSFGGEVKDHAVELTLMLCDLQDPFNTEDFDELKIQSLIAVLLSDVKTLAPWLSKQAFAGDYGLGQRCIMLSALGLGGRELAGFKNMDELNPVLSVDTIQFPSKRLPGRLHAIYDPANSSVKRLHAATETAQHQLIKPLALSAADESTAHLNAVKVRTFSSRMDLERTKRKPAANELAKIFGSCFFFPMATRYQQDVAAYGAASVFTSAPFVLVTFLKTLALLLHASGPATVELPVITTAFWDLILSLRVQAVNDVSVLAAVLFAFLTLLEVNANQKQMLAADNSPQLMQTQQWVEMVFERISGGDFSVDGDSDETRVRTLAAGVLVKIREIVEERQKLLMGNLR